MVGIATGLTQHIEKGASGVRSSDVDTVPIEIIEE